MLIYKEPFILDYFQHNLDLNSQARKNFRLQTNDETTLADETDYVWEPEWSHVFLTSQMISQVQHLQIFQYTETT